MILDVKLAILIWSIILGHIFVQMFCLIICESSTTSSFDLQNELETVGTEGSENVGRSVGRREGKRTLKQVNYINNIYQF